MKNSFPPSAIVKRPPLSATARRAGWVGCNFALNRIPADARIEIIATRSSGHKSARSNSDLIQSRLTSAATGESWVVRNLLLIPHFAFPPSAIVKRPPLSSTARRAGWVGCNFALNRIPADARIPIVTTRNDRRSRGEGRVPEALTEKGDQSFLTSSPTIIVPPEEVRERFQRIKPLRDLSVTQRGWTLDVLNIVRRLSARSSGRQPAHSNSDLIQSRLTSAATNEFTNADIYAFEKELAALHPDNRHIRDKIRQQLQVLRDLGFLFHVGEGIWRLK